MCQNVPSCQNSLGARGYVNKQNSKSTCNILYCNSHLCNNKSAKMSQALLKRCLEIVESDLAPAKSSTSSNATKSSHKSKKNDSIMDLIPESQRLTCYTRDTKTKTKRKWKRLFLQLLFAEMDSPLICRKSQQNQDSGEVHSETSKE